MRPIRRPNVYLPQLLIAAISLASPSCNAEGVALVGVGGLMIFFVLSIIGLIALPFLLPSLLRRANAIIEREFPRDGFYADGTKIHVGDRVRIGKTTTALGTVVIVVASGSWSEGFRVTDYPTLRCGFMVKTDEGQLHHFLAATKYVVPLRDMRAASADG